MIVMEIIDDEFVGVCNGRNRKISNPKKKKIKHLTKTNDVVESIKERLENGIKVGNTEIRSLLETYQDSESDPQEQGETIVEERRN